jgi:hypothetical protein
MRGEHRDDGPVEREATSRRQNHSRSPLLASLARRYLRDASASDDKRPSANSLPSPSGRKKPDSRLESRRSVTGTGAFSCIFAVRGDQSEPRRNYTRPARSPSLTNLGFSSGQLLRVRRMPNDLEMHRIRSHGIFIALLWLHPSLNVLSKRLFICVFSHVPAHCKCDNGRWTQSFEPTASVPFGCRNRALSRFRSFRANPQSVTNRAAEAPL